MHMGFYDSIVAAPSQKSALAAWGARPTQFSQGFAAVTKDPAAVEAALAQPGVVLKRPFGSTSEFKNHADVPNAPKLNAKQKRVTANAKAQRKEREATKARAAKAAEKRRAKKAQDELAAIEREEKELRNRRQALQKKFHLRSV